MEKVLVSLVTHSAYKDICENFVALFNKNWNTCTFDFIISVVGDDVRFDDIKTIYHGKHCQLPMAIYNVMVESDYDYCISFLGDAFINSPVDNLAVEQLLSFIQSKRINYCCLIPRIPFRLKKKTASKDTRYISVNDAYNMCFVAFIASKKFVLEEFNNISDLEFETKYLGNTNKNNFYYDDRVILTRNIFNLEPGIDAGMWNRRAIKKLNRDNEDIIFSERKKVPVLKSIKNNIIQVMQIFISKKQRFYLKTMISRIFKVKFMTKY